MIKACMYCREGFETNRRTRAYCCRECANKHAAEKRHGKLLSTPAVNVWACGGGVDSTAIALLICQGKLSRPDYAIMTDCGYETPKTWQHVNEVIKPRLQEVGVTLHVIRSSAYTDTNIIDKQGRCRLPAYRMENGKPARLSTRCSGGWKVTPARRWLREQGVKRMVNWVGIAADEARRAKPAREQWITSRWPLIEYAWTRERCMYELGKAGWPLPPRTSCYLCPQRTDASWQAMATDEPEAFALAVVADERLQADCGAFLHRSCKPLSEVFRTRQILPV